MHYEVVTYMKIGYAFLLFFLSTILKLHAVPALSSDDPIIYDAEAKCSIAKGNAEFLNKGLRIQADKICYFSENAKALGDGQVRVTYADLRLLTPSGTYWPKTQMLTIDEFKMAVRGHFIQGEHLHGPLKFLTAENIKIDYHGVQNDVVGVHVTAKEGEIKPGQYFALRHAVFRVGQVPVFYLPYYRHDFDESVLRWKAEVSLLKDDKTFGRYVRNDLMFNLGNGWKPGVLFDYYGKRNLLVGGCLDYNQTWGHGTFRAARIQDKKWVKNTKTTRYLLELKHHGYLSGSTDLTVQMGWMHDADFIKDFRPDDNNSAYQHPDNFVEVSHRTQNSVTSLLTRYRLNHFQHYQERLPELKFDYLPVAWEGTPFYYQYGFGISHLREKFKTRAKHQWKRLDAYVGLSVPINLGDGCTFTPVANGRVMQYLGLNQGKRRYTRCLGQIGFDLACRAYGDYNYTNEYWNIHNLRHVVQPIMQYRYMPKGHQGHAYIPAIDREKVKGAKPSLRSIDLLNRRDIDDLDDMHLFRIGVENFLYTNYAQGVGSQWMRFNVYQDIYLKKNSNNFVAWKHVSDTLMDFEWTPSNFFELNQYLRFDPSRKTLKEANMSVSFSENDLWRFTCSHEYIKDIKPVNQDSLTVSYRINSTNVVSAKLIIDAKKGKFIKQVYKWSTVIQKTWGLDLIFEWKKRPLADRDKKDSWGVKFALTFVEW